ENVYIPVDLSGNFVSPSPFDRGQPSWFMGATGDRPTTPMAFATNFTRGVTLSWALGNRLVNATADHAASKTCAFKEDGQDGPAVIIDGQEVTLTPDPARIAAHARTSTEQSSPGI